MTASCVCCANKGALPHLPGTPEVVAPGTVERMCDPCIGAAFLGAWPHPHTFDPFGTGDAAEFTACRECAERKHGACDGSALVDDGTDVVSVDCLCAAADHFGEGS